jgi:hypothetical protein
MSTNRLSELNEQIPKVFGEVIEKAKIGDIPEIIRALAQVDSETERAIYVEQLAKKFGIKSGKIAKDIKNTQSNRIKNKKVTANFEGLIDLAINDDGEIVFLIKGLDLTIEKRVEVDDIVYTPPQKDDIPFSLPRAEYVVSHYRRYYDGVEQDGKLFDDVIEYFKRFSYISDRYWPIVVLCVFLTYIQDCSDIHYLPILLFYAVPERGKTRTGKAFIYVARRGVHQVDLREANLFRYSQNLQATLFLDIKNLWKKAERNGSEDILLLRYEKGAQVSRVLYPEKGVFQDMVHFKIYGPTIIATNEAVHKILDSRCIPINMENRPGIYEDPTAEKAQELKERLTAWRARVMDETFPEIEPIQGLNGRLWDVSKPLLQVCKMVCPHMFEGLKDALFEIADQRLEDKKESIEGQIVTILDELSPEGIPEWTIKTSDLLNRLNETRPEKHKLSPQYLGKKIRAMGISTKIIMGYSEIKLKKADFDDLLKQYGIISSLPPEKTLPNSTTLSNQGISTVYDSRELVESQGNSTETLLSQSLDNQAFGSLVESSRELPGGRQQIITNNEDTTCEPPIKNEVVTPNILKNKDNDHLTTSTTYPEGVEEINKKDKEDTKDSRIYECTLKRLTDKGSCGKYVMKLHPSGELEAWCKKYKRWCLE